MHFQSASFILFRIHQVTPITDSITFLSISNYFVGIMTIEAWLPAARKSVMNF